MLNRIVRLGLLASLLVLSLWGCGREHGPLICDCFPAPILDARITGAESLELSWDWNDEGTEWFMLYRGTFVLDEEMGIIEVLTLVDSTESSPAELLVENLTEYDEELGDTLHKFIFLRVVPKTGGVEGLRSPAALPHW